MFQKLYFVLLWICIEGIRLFQKWINRRWTPPSNIPYHDATPRYLYYIQSHLNSKLYAQSAYRHEQLKNCAVQSWIPNNPVVAHVFFLPGFNQCAFLQYEYFISKMLNHSIAVHAVDYPGSDSMVGEIGELNERSLDDLNLLVSEAFEFVQGKYSRGVQKLHLCGFSMGSLLSIHLLQNYSDKIDKCVLMAPVVLPVHQIIVNTIKSLHPTIARWTNTPMWTLSDDLNEMKQYEQEMFISKQLPPSACTLWTVHNLCTSVQKLLMNPKLQKDTLWIHGQQDSIMPCTQLEQVLHRLNCLRVYIPGANHSLLFGVSLEVKDQVCGNILDFYGATSSPSEKKKRETTT